MVDPVQMLALRRAVQDSALVEVQLSNTHDCGPLIAVLAKAKQDAGEAIADLVDVDAEDPKKIRALQNKVVRFRDLIAWLSQIVAEGFEADATLEAMDEQDREDLTTMIAGEEIRVEDSQGGM